MRYVKLGKTAFAAPLYISIAWSLIISYQLFTQTAVNSIVTFLAGVLPSIGELLISNVHIIVFIHAFAWIFVLSSVIPSIILGKRSILLQFLLVLTITLVAMFFENILAQQMQNLFVWFQNQLIAGIYLSAPYLFMLYLDLHSRKREWVLEEEKTEASEIKYLEQRLDTVLPIETTQTEHEVSETETNWKESGTDQVPQGKGTRRINFLHGTSMLCFLLAVSTYLFSNTLQLSTLTMPYKLIYPSVLIILGVTMLILGCKLTKMQRREIAPITHYSTEGEEKFEEKEMYFEKSGVEPISASLERQALEQTGTPSKELMGKSESVVEIQIANLDEEIPGKMEKYDVRHPKEVIDSQC